jgi:hypothetical protein
MESAKKDPLAKPEAPEQPKRPYQTPQLVRHGTVEEITQAFGVGPVDGLGGSRFAP